MKGQVAALKSVQSVLQTNGATSALVRPFRPHLGRRHPVPASQGGHDKQSCKARIERTA